MNDTESDMKGVALDGRGGHDALADKKVGQDRNFFGEGEGGEPDEHLEGGFAHGRRKVGAGQLADDFG